MLGRATGGQLGRAGKQVRLRGFVSVRGVYDTGLTIAGVDENGQVPNVAAGGVETQFGGYGAKTWRKTRLSVDYQGGYRAYTQQTFFSGIDQFLSVGVTHQLGRRWTLQTSNVGGYTTRGFGIGFGFTPIQIADSVTDGIPSDDIFDNRTFFLSTNNSLVYAPTPRLSFSFGGGANSIQRNSRALSSLFGVTARGDVAYRIARRQTIGVSYTFNQFNFARQYGNSTVDSININYSVDIGRAWSINTAIGGSRVTNEGIEQVTLDPLIAAITGQRTGLAAFYRDNYLPRIQGTITRKFRRASANFSYTRGVTAGNGLFFTMRSTSYGGGFNYTGIRRWALSASAMRMEGDALLRLTGRSINTSVGGTAGYQIRPEWQLSINAGFRDSQIITPGGFNRDSVRLSVGISWSPGEIPLALW